MSCYNALQGRAALLARLKVSVNRYVCPWCGGTGRWEDGGCESCSGSGTTDSAAHGVDMSERLVDEDVPLVPPERLPRPPAVMAAPCVDCAYRPGSPERGEDDDPIGLPGPDGPPFYCHEGLRGVPDGRGGTGYLSQVEMAGLPVGAMVCASWWAQAVEGRKPPKGPYRERTS